MSVSDRVLSGSLTKGSTAIPVGENATQSNLESLRQGKDLRTLDDITTSAIQYIRSNSTQIKTIDGRDVNQNVFDDTHSPQILSGSSAEISPAGIAGRISFRLNHEIEKRDLGQSDVYLEDDFFEAVNSEDPLEIIDILDRGRLLPASLVDHHSLSSMDGKLDPLDVIGELDRSATDFPYQARGVKGALQQSGDFLDRATIITDVYNIPGDHFVSASYYIDAPENFGNVMMPSVLNFDSPDLEPHTEQTSDVYDYLDRADKFTEDGDSDILEALRSCSFVVDDERGRSDKITKGGFVYETDETDSLVYGGMKR